MNTKWKIVGRHKWVVGAKITESISQDEQSYSRFTATIRGFQNWKLFEGRPTQEALQLIIDLVRIIRDRIDNGDEEIFVMGMSHCHNATELQERVAFLEETLADKK